MVDENHELYDILKSKGFDAEPGKDIRQEFDDNFKVYFDDLISENQLKWCSIYIEGNGDESDEDDIKEFNNIFPIKVMDRIMKYMADEFKEYLDNSKGADQYDKIGLLEEYNVTEYLCGAGNLVALNEDDRIHRARLFRSDLQDIIVGNEKFKEEIESEGDEYIINFYNVFLSTDKKYTRYKFRIMYRMRNKDDPTGQDLAKIPDTEFKEKYEKYNKEEILGLLYIRENRGNFRI